MRSSPLKKNLADDNHQKPKQQNAPFHSGAENESLSVTIQAPRAVDWKSSPRIN